MSNTNVSRVQDACERETFAVRGDVRRLRFEIQSRDVPVAIYTFVGMPFWAFPSYASFVLNSTEMRSCRSPEAMEHVFCGLEGNSGLMASGSSTGTGRSKLDVAPFRRGGDTG